MNPAAPPTVDPRLAIALRRHIQAATGRVVALVGDHISWVLLTDAMAYKLKKPVHLSFVDFRTLAARKHFCEEELRLNKALAPALYLDVLPVLRPPGAPCIGGDGEAIDYVVCMRAFPTGCCCATFVAVGASGAVRTRRPGAPAGGLSRDRAPGNGDVRLRRAGAGRTGPCWTPFDRLDAQCGRGRIEPLRRWVEGHAADLRMAWLLRQRTGGYVRECHGDLHLGNVVRLDGELLPFDCIEFDPALRWIDVMSDVAFLTMDLKAHGRADLAFRFLDRYLQHTGDYEGLPVLRFHEVHRALVRALVTGLSPTAGALAVRKLPALRRGHRAQCRTARHAS
jgi:aminoglycoside phosphotransferase family enzyme